ncbi:2-acylglycerol O-acyltransferase 2-A-like, partial [Achroia grisella]|uniref:2-acylglycerol O-acyltransferase 2-A-like n=1 Tax=Achroia grisella TaxID=688607 RepID=UPI0027D20018
SRVSEALGIQWAPRDVPMIRRLQTLAAAAWISLILFGEAISIYLLYRLVYSRLWWVAFLYLVWMINDIDTCNKGGRRWEWVRNWAWWRYYCEYFPMNLIKTTELDPSKNYLFACFPHGVVSTGILGLFNTNALNFYKVFPGMTPHFITLRGHFLVPFFRDLIMAMGSCSSSVESLLYLLNKKKHQGKCVALVVGGAAEALDAHPGEYKVILSRRKGFIRVAIQSGAPLVPVLTFGEPDVFRPMNNPENGFLRKFQDKFRQLTGISPVVPVGRGFMQYSFGIIPLRTPLTIVVGKPMEVKRIIEPTNEEVDAVHAEFTQTLIKFFNEEKSKYLKNHQDVQLTII